MDVSDGWPDWTQHRPPSVAMSESLLVVIDRFYSDTLCHRAQLQLQQRHDQHMKKHTANRWHQKYIVSVDTLLQLQQIV